MSLSNIHQDIQRIIFNERANSFDTLSWVSNRDFLGHIFEIIYKFAEEQKSKGFIIKRFLDVGTGTGEVLKYLSEIYRNQNLLAESIGIGIDISERMIAIAKSKLSLSKKVSLINCSIYDSELEYDSFDFIICRNSFHHFHNPDYALVEMRKLARKFGKIFIIEGVAPNNYTLEKWKDILTLKDIGRNNIYLSLENIEEFFKNNYNLEVKYTELTPVKMLLSNWLGNAVITDDTRREIIKMMDKLYKDEIFRNQFGLEQIVKAPVDKKDYEFKKRSVLIEIDVVS
ncbi:MAG: class I SAM-dependent methyltransferase [Actinobacteria bacterium]|nr:class I SAM-dependent methyltransferase [Actinomycetota bacterium]